MIVKDKDTLEQAMDLTKVGQVTYSDAVRFCVMDNTEELRVRLQRQLDNNDIAIVTLLSSQEHMENYDLSLKMVRRERRIAEQKAVRHWVTENADRAARLARARGLVLK
jgi:hypothetical protein